VHHLQLLSTKNFDTCFEDIKIEDAFYGNMFEFNTRQVSHVDLVLNNKLCLFMTNLGQNVNHDQHTHAKT
jgi:hypothetical protein